jgi:hypothetical protein
MVSRPAVSSGNWVDRRRPRLQDRSFLKRYIFQILTGLFTTGCLLLFHWQRRLLQQVDLPQPHSSVRTSSNYVKSSNHASLPPEPIEYIKFCAEKCKHLPQMCTENLHRDKLALPAPSCHRYSTTVKDDIYWPTGTEATKERNMKTNILIDWVAKEARAKRQSLNFPSKPCEEIYTQYEGPMMFPEEFEFVTKLMANILPATYLEWGCGMSTSFYPLMATTKVVAIDGYAPWCKMVGEEPRVQCMREEGKVHFYCPELVGGKGLVGKLDKGISDEDLKSTMETYVNSVSQAVLDTNITHFDVALVDGRFRLQCATKLLPYLHSDSVLLMHDFWLRQGAYGDVLKYFYVIGYARSVVALKKRPELSPQDEGEVYKKYMNRESLTWTDLE